jgi:hypothetical protein
VKIASKLIRWFIAPMALLIVAASAHAQTSKPMLVISLPSYEKLMADVDFFGELRGQPGGSQQLEAMVQVFTQGQGLKGLDKSKPWGVAVLTSGSDVEPVAFLPVTNVKDLLDALAGVIGPAQDEGGAWKINPPGAPPLYVRENNGWGYITQVKDSPLPDDPMKLLANLNTEYDLAARGYLQNVPPEMRKAAMDQLKALTGTLATMQQKGSQPPMMAEMQRKNMETQIEAIEQFVNEAEQLTLGWSIDTKQKTTHFDCVINAVAGSQLDKQLQLLQDTHTDFAGFMMPGSAALFNRAGKFTPDQIEKNVAALEQAKEQALQSIDSDGDLSDEEKTALKDVLPQLIESSEQSIKAGKYDSGATLMVAPGKLQGAVGAFVADGPALDASIVKLIDGPGLKAGVKKLLHAIGTEESDLDQLTITKTDLEAYKGIRFHQVSIKLPEHLEKVRKILGDTVEVYFGNGAKSGYLAFGPGSLDLLKKAIDASAAQPNKAVLPMQASIDLAPIVNFIASVKEDDSSSPTIKAFADELNKVKEKDHLVINVKPISGGSAFRIEVEEGILEAIGQTSKLRTEAKHGPAGKAPVHHMPKSGN